MSQTDQPTGGRRRAEGEPVVIKKYANRRLYNTASSSYVTLEHLAEMVRQGTDFVVYDAKTNEDLTRSVLTQIIFEEENNGAQNLLPLQFLRQLIRFYGDSMQALLPSYLEMSLDGFTKQRERLQVDFSSAFGGAEAFDRIQDQVRQNLQMFDRAMKMFTPLAYGRPEGAEESAASPASATPSASDESLTEMKSQIEAMQKQIEKLISSKS
ncbi:MAG TPA: polyhydroxyalkanoate synthesis repressor PhaR [Caulobacteraceae bacterium]